VQGTHELTGITVPNFNGVNPVFLATLNTGPTVTGITADTDNGEKEIGARQVVTITANTSETVYVTGTPTLQLNNNEVAGYTGGTGSDSLTFAYTVQSGDDTSDLQVSNLNMPNGATIEDATGNELAPPVTAGLGIQINTIDPIVTGVSTTPWSGDFKAGDAISIFLTLSGPVKVKGGRAAVVTKLEERRLLRSALGLQLLSPEA
jgi:hypothetical protein